MGSRTSTVRLSMTQYWDGTFNSAQRIWDIGHYIGSICQQKAFELFNGKLGLEWTLSYPSMRPARKMEPQLEVPYNGAVVSDSRTLLFLRSMVSVYM